MTNTAEPQIEFIPLKPATNCDAATTLDVLIRISAPQRAPISDGATPNRPALNLALVLDRSGSMSGEKIHFARLAARYAVQQLVPTDRVSIVAFDDRVETIVPSRAATDVPGILRAIDGISDRGSTALHAGWVEGATQVSAQLEPSRLNRVILLSDGVANVGETNPDRIASDVHGLAMRGVSTSAMGVGQDFNEDLLEAVANSGDGNYHFIESPNQLPAIFEAELRGLLATFGKRVSLGLEPKQGARVIDVLNDLERTDTGRCKLTNLTRGQVLEVVVRLSLPAGGAGTGQTPFEWLGVRLAWDDTERGARHSIRRALALPAVSDGEFRRLFEHELVRERVALLEVARAKHEMTRRIDKGEAASIPAFLAPSMATLAAAPQTSEVRREIQALEELKQASQENAGLARKRAKAQMYDRQKQGKSL